MARRSHEIRRTALNSPLPALSALATSIAKATINIQIRTSGPKNPARTTITGKSNDKGINVLSAALMIFHPYQLDLIEDVSFLA